LKIFLISFASGLLVGVFYSLLQVRSPAPPVEALIGLLGILIGEQVVPVFRSLTLREAKSEHVVLRSCADHVLGEMPSAHRRRPPTD
jgi:XapX domain-containing protein